MIGKCAHLLGGMIVDDESLAVDVTHDVGPGGQFLNHRHTAKHFRSNWSPELEDRAELWQLGEAGSLAMRDRVNAKVRELIERPPAGATPRRP